MVAGNQIWVDLALTLPRVKVVDLAELRRGSHPLDGLVVGHKPNVLLLDHLVNESHESPEVALLLEPDGVEIETKWGPVCRVMAFKVGSQHVEHFVLGQVSRTRVHHGTGVALNVERIHDHLPHAWECARRTLLSGSVASVRNSVVHGEWPQRVGVWLASLRWRNHGGVVQESKLLHHDHLGVPANAQEGNPNAAQIVKRDAGKLVDDVGHAGKLVEPILHGGIECPPQLGLSVCDRVDGNLVAVVP